MKKHVMQILSVQFSMMVALAAAGCGSPAGGSSTDGEGPERGSSVEGASGDSVVPALFPPSDPVVTSYGPLIVELGEFQAESEVRPWSGSWLPARDSWLTSGAESPLQVWDDWVRDRLGFGFSSAWAIEKELNRDSYRALSWEGSCDAWAIASLYESEPVRPIRWGGRRELSVGLQKAILVKAWERVEGKRIFGQPYRGDRESDWSDPSPLAVHRFIQAELFEQGRPFIVDKDPGIPVWNTPVFATAFRVTRDAHEDSLLQVHAWLKGADPLFENPDAIGTHITWIELRYELRVQAIDDKRFFVVDSHWVQDPALGIDSVEFHPDFLVGLPPRGSEVENRSRNSAITEAVVEQLRQEAGLIPRNP